MLKAQREHASSFQSSTAEEEPPETRYDPIEVDLNAPEPKKGESGRVEQRLDPGPGADELRAQLRQAQEAAAAATRAAQEQSQRAMVAEQRAVGSTVGMIDSAIEAAQSASANAKAKFQAALDAADHAVAAQAQEEIADARHNLLRLQEQRSTVEAQLRQQQQAPPQRQQPQPQQVDVNTIARDLVNGGYPRSADWLRSHPEWASRPDLLKRVASADNHLVDNRGLVRESDEYFSALEQELGMGQQQRRAGGPDYGQQRRSAPPASAPTSNASMSLRTGQPQMRSHIPLSPAQREAAELSGMTEKEYAQSFEEARVSNKLIGYR
jgi:hypothetical protein